MAERQAGERASEQFECFSWAREKPNCWRQTCGSRAGQTKRRRLISLARSLLIHFVAIAHRRQSAEANSMGVHCEWR